MWCLKKHWCLQKKIQGTNKMNHLYFYHPEITTIGILLNFVLDRVVFKIICVHMLIMYICIPTMCIFVLILSE